MGTVPYRRPNANVNPETKPLPHSLEAERAVLGAILLDNSAMRGALEYLQVGDFFLPEHQRLFRHMLELHEAKQPIDTVVLFDRLQTAGELEMCGGAGYLSSITDGLPRVTNVAHYARIVLEKSRLRSLIYSAQTIQEKALTGTIPASDIVIELNEARNRVLRGQGAKLVTVDVEDFLTMNLPPLEYAIEPILTTRGRGMVFSPRGMGKTYFCLEGAYSIATGTPFFVWPIEKARPVVYVEGEMNGSQLQERLRHLVMTIHEGRVWDPGFLKLCAIGLPNQTLRPKINTAEGRAQIESLLIEGAVLMLDNLTALSPSSDEKETEDWAEIQEWLIELSWRGVSTIFVHHAGKSGEQRGTSKREDLLDFVLALKTPSDYSREEGLRAEVHITKMRGRAMSLKHSQPFEVKLDGEAWTTRPLRDLLRQRAKEMLEAGMRPNDVALETGLTRFTVYRLSREVKNNLVSVDPDHPNHPPNPF